MTRADQQATGHCPNAYGPWQSATVCLRLSDPVNAQTLDRNNADQKKSGKKQQCKADNANTK